MSEPGNKPVPADGDLEPKLDLSHARLAAGAPSNEGPPPAEKTDVETPSAGTPDPETPVAETLDAQPDAAMTATLADEVTAVAAPVDLEHLARTVEALLFAAEAPLTVREMARAASVGSADVRKAIETIRENYDMQNRPWELVESGKSLRLVTRPEYFPAIQRLKALRSQRKLTQAALETLALIAYSKEPVTRAEVEAVRGVDSGQVLRQLLDRKLIKIAGRGTGLGQALLYAVSNYFLEHFGLKSAQDLPRPGEFKSA